jgi:hypothetical protein
MQDIINFQERRILTAAEIRQKIYGNYPSLSLDYNAVINAIPPMWKHWIRTEHLNLNNYEREENIEAQQYNVKVKYIKQTLQNKIKDQTVQPRANSVWQTKLNVELNAQHWTIARYATKETRLRELHWKILHNIYPTNILLQKMKIKQTDLCDYCKTNVDYTEHFFFECKYLKPFWKDVEFYLLQKLDKLIRLNVNVVMFGCYEENLLETERKYINNIILIAKMCISIAKKKLILFLI